MARVVALMALAAVVAPRTAQADPQVSDVDRQISAASDRLETLVEQHNAARADLAATRARAAATNERIAVVARGLTGARDRVNAIAVWAYKTEPTSGISAMLAAGSPEVFMSRLMTISALTRTDRNDIQHLADSTRDLTAEQASLRTLADQQSHQEAELAALRAQVESDITGLRLLRERIGTTSRRAPSTPDRRARNAPPPPPVTGSAGRAVAFAYAQMGKPYAWGADGPGSYDCSGLTSAAWHAAGVLLPHNAARQYSAVSHISRDQLRPGDLVFYYRDIHHVAMYVGNGSVIHAPNTGDHVRVQPIDNAPVHGYGRPN